MSYEESKLLSLLKKQDIDSLFLEATNYLCQTKSLFEEKKQLQQENEQLKEKLDCDLQWAFKYEKQVDNWNKLREYLTNRYNNGTESISYRQVFLEIREMMQKLEQGSNSNE